MSSSGVGYFGGGGVETDVVVYTSRRNDKIEIWSIKIFISFNLCQLSVIYLASRQFLILFFS